MFKYKYEDFIEYAFNTYEKEHPEIDIVGCTIDDNFDSDDDGIIISFVFDDPDMKKKFAALTKEYLLDIFAGHPIETKFIFKFFVSWFVCEHFSLYKELYNEKTMKYDEFLCAITDLMNAKKAGDGCFSSDMMIDPLQNYHRLGD